MNISLIDQANFADDVLGSDLPVIVDFFTNMCLPCQALEPVLQQLAEQYQGKVKCVKLNISLGRNAEIAKKYHIEDVPTLLLIKNAQPIVKKSMFGDFVYDENGMLIAPESKTELSSITLQSTALFIEQYI